MVVDSRSVLLASRHAVSESAQASNNGAVLACELRGMQTRKKVGRPNAHWYACICRLRAFGRRAPRHKGEGSTTAGYARAVPGRCGDRRGTYVPLACLDCALVIASCLATSRCRVAFTLSRYAYRRARRATGCESGRWHCRTRLSLGGAIGGAGRCAASAKAVSFRTGATYASTYCGAETLRSAFATTAVNASKSAGGSSGGRPHTCEGARGVDQRTAQRWSVSPAE